MKNAQATIRDIAIKLNISISTVSRALRGAPDVNAETKKSVLEMAEKLSYEPNRIAQSLRIKRTKTIGVIVPEINLHFFSSALSGIQDYCASRGYSIMICQSMESIKTEKSNIQMLVSNRVDGLIISLSSQTENLDHLRQLVDKSIPIVLFDRVTDELNVSKVIVDDHDGAFKAVSHLVRTGCRRIAYVGGPEGMYISKQRKKGYSDALREHGQTEDPALSIHCQDLQTEVPDALRKLLHDSPDVDAIFCLNDPIAIIALQILKEKKIQIPNQVSVVGFTNEPVSALIEPSLTTVSQPSHEMGKTAARLFIDQLEYEGEFIPVTEVMKTELLIRNSTRKN
jgi:DNA-binding LacI/PurR family transcriptional regulator